MIELNPLAFARKSTRVLKDAPAGRFWTLCTHIICVLTVVSSLLYQQGSYLHLEGSIFFTEYLKVDNLLKAMFDFQTFDYGWGYQARELSHLFDSLDAYFLLFSWKLGLVHFYSLFHFLVIGIICFGFLRETKTHFGKRFQWAALLLLLLFLTSPAVFLGGFYFRTSKIGVAGIVMCTGFWLLDQYQKRDQEKRFSWSSAAVLSVLVFCASWFDLQGFFLGSLLALALTLRAYLFRTRIDKVLASGAIAGVVTSRIYNTHLAPWIIERIYGTRPGFEKLRMEELNSFFSVRLLNDSAALMLDHFNFFFGNLDRNLNTTFTFAGVTLILILVTAFGFSLLERSKDSTKYVEALRALYPLQLVVLFSVSLYVMYVVMVQKFNPVLWEDVRLIYYALPVDALMLFTSAYMLFRIQKRWPSSLKPICAALAMLLLANIYSIPTHSKTAWGGYLKTYKWTEDSETLRKCILDTSLPSESFAFSKYNVRLLPICQLLRTK